MQLTRIQIKNFRSIKSQTIEFDHNCLILVGKNEAGKSNILKAIAAVFDKYIVSDKDKRKRIDNEKIDAYYVRAILKLSDDDFKEILTRFQSQYTNTESIVFKSGKMLLDYINLVFREFLLQIDIANGGKTHYSCCSYNESDWKLESDIYLQGNSFTITVVEAKQDIKSLLFKIVQKLYNENPYKCHYWKYDESYLLPSSVVITDFTTNSSKYKSLENIFSLCKRENIKKEFDDAILQDGDYQNLLEQVSNEVTDTFRSIWKDFKETSIKLSPDGVNILIKIKDKVQYSCEDRSDGFKKFITILLMLSTQMRAKKLGERDIILIDEPDQSLYPTSARYLRDELLKISEKAKIIYSTHSPYMIDSNCIDRHLIVEKKDEVTTANKQEKNASFSNDELLRQAMGTSIFECLQDKNIIFEGWLDKELFQKYCDFNKKTKEFDGIGKVYLGGISGVETLVQLLILANKKFVIVADSDKASIDKQKEFTENYKEFSNCWLAYADVVKNVSTMEDFITAEHITKCIKQEFSDFKYNELKNAIKNIESVTKPDKEQKQKIKNKLVEELDKNSIKDDYNQFINRLESRIKNDTN
ncbi:MAG: AAA family ATPase [Bacteroidales bacterium]|jgi:predicted ATP-dependent endonuclease of OLD family|nr:AAA family ATPase [Bacteroidales bacterium]